MREIIGHRINPAKPESLVIHAVDEPGAGGANHVYEIKREGNDPLVAIWFQNGPIAEVGINGVTHEALIAILIDRLKAFQEGPYACPENLAAWSHLAMAQSALFSRTLARAGRGVEGTSKL